MSHLDTGPFHLGHRFIADVCQGLPTWVDGCNLRIDFANKLVGSLEDAEREHDLHLVELDWRKVYKSCIKVVRECLLNIKVISSFIKENFVARIKFKKYI